MKAKRLWVGAVAATLLVLWAVIGPVQIGGPAGYVTTYGNSMEPRYHGGDLVITRSADFYGVGEIIAYRSRALGKIVLHRIVREEADGFVTKGDNNSWNDPDRVETADVIGRAWVHVPRLGKVLQFFRTPAGLMGLGSLIGLTFLVGGGRQKRRRERRGERRGRMENSQRVSLDNFSDRQKTALGVLAALTAMSVMLFIFSLVRPPVRQVMSGAAYTHSGSYAYSADVPTSLVYPDGKIGIGDPIFTRVVDRLRISFDYRLKTNAEVEVSGRISLAARIHGESGWAKSIQLAEPRPFDGHEATVQGMLDLSDVRSIIRKAQLVTGVAEAAPTIDLVPSVLVKGQLAGQTLDDEFEPNISLNLGANQIQLRSDDDSSSPSDLLSVSEGGSLSAAELEANNFSLGGITVERSDVLRGSLLALLLAAAGTALMWRRFRDPSHADEPAFIAAQYGDWMVPVEAMQDDVQRMVRVKTIQALMRLAEVYERMILHEVKDGVHSYFIEEEGVIYCYQTSEKKKAQPDAAPPVHPPPPPAPTAAGLPRRLQEAKSADTLKRLRDELKELEEQLEDPAASREE